MSTIETVRPSGAPEAAGSGARGRPGPRALRLGLAGALLASVLLLLGTDRPVEASRPGELARLVPPGVLVLLEAEDLPALARRWTESELATDLGATSTYRRATSERLGLRLRQRLELFEAALREPVTMARIGRLPGTRGALALYGITDTRFVLWLRTSAGAAGRLELLAEGLEVSRHEVSGHRYAVHRGLEGQTMDLAVGVVGDLLLVSNDPVRFEQAVRLAAGQRGPSLGAEPTYRALAAKAPASAQAHVYLDMERVGPSRQFQRYWVHGNQAELAGIERVMLSATWQDAGTFEHRALAYRDAGPRLPAGERGEGNARLAALPAGAFASLRATPSAAEAAGALRWLWPGAAEQPADLERLLAPGRPVRLVEVVRTAVEADGLTPSDGLAVGVLLAGADALGTDAVVEAAAAAFERALTAGRRVRPVVASRAVSGLPTTLLSAPLAGGPDLALARSADGAVLVLASSSALAAELARAAAPGEALGAALRAEGPDVARADYGRAAPVLGRRLELVVRRPPAPFLAQEVPELLGVPALARIERLAWREGAIDRQEVRYIH